MSGAAHQDPRIALALLGLGVGDGDPRGPADDADFDRLIAALERWRAASGRIWLAPGLGGGDRVVLDFEFDEELNREVKRIPGRRFDWESREWIAPANATTAPHVAAVLARHPELIANEHVRDWLAEGTKFHGSATVHQREGEPVLAILTHAGGPPPELVDAAIERIDGWIFLALTPSVVAAVAAGVDGLILDDLARSALADIAAGRPPAGARMSLERDDDGEERLVVRTGWDRGLRDAFGEFSEAEPILIDGEFLLAYDDVGFAVPADPATSGALRSFIAAGAALAVSPEAESRLDELCREHARAVETVALSRAEEAEPLTVEERLGGVLEPFQRAGVRYALRQRRTFLADEQGLGKTIQALAAIEADEAFPAVVVCPASLKLNWDREARKWLPHRSVAVLNGRHDRGWGAAAGAEVVILNYDILDAHLARLSSRGIRAGVFDESHYAKEPRAKRTKAALALADAVAPEGLRLALTGTPILNRPKELVAQLRLIDRLDDFGSGARLSRRFSRAEQRERLHWHLRAHGYVRRLKCDVLSQLPAKRHVTVPVPLDNDTEYRLAERDVIAWLRSLPLDLRTLEAKVANALRSEQLARLNYLRRLAARGKVRTALAWIEEFLHSGEALVVFAQHREIQRALCERFAGAAHILGDDSLPAREDAVTAFQAADGPQLVVCSLQAASQGLTLTRASNVAFLELDWTPARLEQAEDRCHRMGQRDAVTVYSLLAADTIDETMAKLLAHKRGIIAAVTDGRTPEPETGMIEAVAAELRGEAYRPLRAVA